jgi:diguanylate cyclase (GGDEF)-like protein/PAS domain S-box-containing protein
MKTDSAVQAEMISLVYLNTPTAILGTTVAVFVIWVVFTQLMPIHILLMWSVAVAGSLYLRYTLYARFLRQTESSGGSNDWETLSTVGVGITGLCLGVGGVAIAANVSPFYQGVILVLILGIVVSAIPILGAVKRIYFSYAIGASLPMAVWSAQHWQPVYISTGVMLCVFVWAAWVTSSKYSQTIESLIRTRNALSEATDASKKLQHSYKELARVEQKVRASEDRFRRVFEDGLIGMAILSGDGVVQRVNSAFCRFLGFEPQDLIGKKYRALIHSDQSGDLNINTGSPGQRHVTSQQQVCRYEHKNGNDVYGSIALTTIRDDTGDVLGTLAQVQDVTEERGIRKQLSYQASHDDLTGLINRREFQLHLEGVVKSAKAHGTQHVLCYLDLDHFKIVNDTFGHAAGDAALIQITRIIQNSARSRDTIARLGGDEFGIIFRYCTAAEAEAISSEIVRALNNTKFIFRSREFCIRASAGLVEVNSESQNFEELMKQADLACYTAKDHGRSQVYLYPNRTDDPSRCSDIIRAVQWMDAIHDERLRLFAQPIVPLKDFDQHISWYEILLRIVSEDGSTISPQCLIPAAERYGQMASIDRWVIDSAFREYQSSAANSRVRFSINLSGTSVCNENLSGYISEKLVEYDVPAENICFELTETAAIKNNSEVLDFMNSLKRCGCVFALDDFGSGLSSFRYLKQFPFDFLKIDGSLIHDIADDPANNAMIRAIQQLSASLELVSIAEWVSTEEVAEIVTTLGIDYGQGFFYNEPMPIKEIWQD